MLLSMSKIDNIILSEDIVDGFFQDINCLQQKINEIKNNSIPSSRQRKYEHQYDSPLSIYYHNSNGLLTKLQSFQSNVFISPHQIYCLTETGLNDSVSSSELFPVDFNVYRCDRSNKTSHKNGKGGTLISIHKTLNSEEILSGDEFGCEQIWTKVQIKNHTILIGSLYIPPQSSISLYAAHLTLINKVINSPDNESTIFLFGDFNLPNIKWQKSDDDDNFYIPINNLSVVEKLVIDKCIDLGLHQMNFHKNDNNRILDLIWSNDPEQISCNLCIDNILKNEIHHKAIIITYSSNVCISEDNKIEYYFDFMNANYTEINNQLSNINWNSAFQTEDINNCMNNFYVIINNIIATNIKKKIKRTTIHPKWFDKNAVNLKNQVNNKHKKWKHTNSPDDRILYQNKRREYKEYVRKKHHEYKDYMQLLIIDDPTNFHKHVKFSKKQSDDLPRSMNYNGIIAKSEEEIGELFRIFFESTYSKPNPNAIQLFNNSTEFGKLISNKCQYIPQINIHEEMVASLINKLPLNLVSGPDNLPNVFLRKCSTNLIKPITSLLKMSFMNAKVPDIWRCSYIRPVFKNGSKNDVSNYRGVAIQCCIIKLLDSLIANHLNMYLRNIISEHQHGFIIGRSTISNLTEFTSSIRSGMKSHNQVDSIYLDISKAFDSVDTQLLCHKLQIMNLNYKILNWIEAYLKNRQQIVKINSQSTSKPVNVTSGVGQGYPIGATLFIMFLMDLPYYIEDSMIHLFADDSKISKAINSIDDCKVLQNDLTSAKYFFDINCLKLNVNKTKQITYCNKKTSLIHNYSLENRFIERVHEIKDLGIIMNNKMTFNNHIEYAISKAKSRLTWIKRYSREFDDPWAIKRLYETFVLPLVEYGSVIWSPTAQTQSNKIESIQKQFLIFALRKFKWQDRLHLPPYKHRLLLFHMNTLEDRRTIAQILFIFYLINARITAPNLLSFINFRIPLNFLKNKFTRNRNKMNQQLLITVDNKDPFNLMQIKFNLYYYLFDICDSSDVVKHKLKFLLKNPFNQT